MCGIAGVVRLGGEPRPVAEDATLAALNRRGPDANGAWHSERVDILHTRLSILDLEPRSNQPLLSPDGRFVLVFNGELYNFRELRDRLAAEGQRFSTTGDGEVLLALLARHGLESLSEVRGMFALALLDRETQSLFLARDPFGIKPLVWAPIDDSTIVFGSTIDALLTLGVGAQLDAQYLLDYLRFGHGVLGTAPLAGVRRVSPGGCVEITGRSVREWHYLDLRDEVAGTGTTSDEELYAIIERSIVRHTVADVPVGVFLSGGIDSAAIAGTMQAAGQRVTSFSVGFAEAGYDESSAAAEVAKALGIDHHTVTFDLGAVPALVSELVEAFDEPFADAAALPTLAVSRRAATEVKVVLSGEGGDEFFGGYRRYLLHDWSARVPRFARRVAARSLSTRSARLARLLSWDSYAEGYVRWLEFGVLSSRRSAYARELDMIRAHQGPENELWSMMLLDQIGWLVDSYLVKLDRATMYHSLEGRVPLIDLDVAAGARRLSDGDRITNPKVGKNLLRAYAARLVGQEHVGRPKHGFAVPMVDIVAHGTLLPLFADVAARANTAGPWARRLARAADGLASSRDPADATRFWYLLVLLAWCDRRGLLEELDCLDEVAERDDVAGALDRFA